MFYFILRWDDVVVVFVSLMAIGLWFITVSMSDFKSNFSKTGKDCKRASQFTNNFFFVQSSILFFFFLSWAFPGWIGWKYRKCTSRSRPTHLSFFFISPTSQCQVQLNRKSLADLAIYEPKTFKSLAALAKRRGEEGLLAAQGEGNELEGIFSRLLKHP